MKKKLFKTLGIIACALILMVGSIAGTYAYLTSTAQTTNTFTVGNVKITMDEAKVDANGAVVQGADRVVTDDTFAYKLIPGHTYIKDPTIHVDDNSEACWLFVRIDDQISAIQDATTIANQLAANGWTPVDGTGVYYYANPVSAGADVVVFNSFKILGTVTNETIDDYANKKIIVTAYAVQADGFTTAYAAWDATFGNTQGA